MDAEASRARLVARRSVESGEARRSGPVLGPHAIRVFRSRQSGGGAPMNNNN